MVNVCTFLLQVVQIPTSTQSAATVRVLRNTVRCKRLSLLQTVHTSSVTHLACYSMDTGVKTAGV